LQRRTDDFPVAFAMLGAHYAEWHNEVLPRP
jgi:hypothetical protein